MELNLKSRFSTVLEVLFRIATPLIFGFTFVILSAFIFMFLNLDLESSFNLIIMEHGVLTVSVLIFLYFTQKWDRYPFNDLNIIHWRKHNLRDMAIVGLVILVLLVLNIILGFVYEIVGIEVASNEIIDRVQEDPVNLLYLIPFMIFFVGPAEELLLRGLVQGVIRDVTKVSVAIVLTSILFGLIHIPVAGGLGMGALGYVITTTMLSLILGYIYEREKTLLIPILAHGLYNSILLIFAYFAIVHELALFL